MNVYIDSNIYLDYFRASSERLSSLSELEKLLSRGRVTLLLPEQTIQEYNRNKSKIVEEFREALIKQSELVAHLAFPEVRHWDEAKKIKKAIDQAKSAYKKLIEKYDKETEKEQTTSEILIGKIFDLGKKIIEDNKVLDKAYLRYLKGNPPRKKDNSLGDAIIWESILEKSLKDDLTIITRDNDFVEDQKRKKVLKNFLRKEWSEKTQKQITLFTSLGQFINKFEGRKIIKEEVIKEEKGKQQSYIIGGGLIPGSSLGSSPINQTSIGTVKTLTSPYYGIFNFNPIVSLADSEKPTFCPSCKTAVGKFDNICSFCGFILRSYIP